MGVKRQKIVDGKKLILLVKNRRFLWDQRENNYHMRDVQKKLWKEVSIKMKSPEEEVKKRWKGLRDTFRKIYIKQMKMKTGRGGHVGQPLWPFFKQLSFLTDTLKPVKTKRVLSGKSDVTSVNNDDFEEGIEELHRDSSSERIQDDQDLSSTPQTSTLNNDLVNFDEKLLEVEYSEEKSTGTLDGDYHFLLSLLPYLHDISKERKLFVRKKIMDVIMEELTPSLHTTSNDNSDNSSSVDHQSNPTISMSKIFNGLDSTVM